MVQEAEPIPEDSERRQAGPVRHHRLPEVRPPQRGMYPTTELMQVVEASHVKLEAVVDSIDKKTLGLMAAIGKIELDNFRERASMGQRGASKAGRIPVSNVPYGYRVGVDGRPEIVQEEAEVVRSIYH